MPTRDDRDAIFEEAKASFEAAKLEFEALERVVKKTVHEGRALTGDIVLKEQSARARLFLARVRLSKVQPLGP